MWFGVHFLILHVVIHLSYASQKDDGHRSRQSSHTAQIIFREKGLLSDRCLSPPVSPPTANATRSFWLDTPGANPLAKEGSTGSITQDADVCIIGSGITGVSVSWHVSQMMKEHESKTAIVVLEAREFCSGATGRNGGHLIPNAFSAFNTRKTKYNTTEAVKSYMIEQYTADALLRYLKERNLEDVVDLSERGHVMLFATQDEELAERQDFAAASKAGLDLNSVRWIDNREFVEKYGLNPKLNYTGVWMPGYNLWPCKLVGELYKDVCGTQYNVSVSLHTRTPVISISRRHFSRRRPWTLHTPRGEVNCTYVVHATNGYAGHLLPSFAGSTEIKDRRPPSLPHSSYPQPPLQRVDSTITPTRGQVAAVRASVPASDLHWRFGWHGSGGWEYWFPRFQGIRDPREEFPLIIMGGGREYSGGNLEANVSDDGALNERVSRALKAFLPRYFPSMFRQSEMEVKWEMEWTGIMGFTRTGDPFVGPVLDPDQFTGYNQQNKYEGQYIVAGYTGHGMVRAYACAEAVAGMIKAQMTGEKWIMPQWLPERYLTWIMRSQ